MLKYLLLIILLCINLIILLTFITKFISLKLVCQNTFRDRCFYHPGYYQNLMKYKQPGFKITKIYWPKNSQNIISYSLFGSNPKYLRYLDDNIKIIKKELPEWSIRVYLHDQSSPEIFQKLYNKKIEIHLVHDELVAPRNGAGTFWRLLPLCENVNSIILDMDDKIDEKNYNQIKDIKKFFNNPNFVLKGRNRWIYPQTHILAGCIFKKKEFKLPYNKTFIMNYPHRTFWGADEVFLTLEVVPHAIKQGLDINKQPFFIPYFTMKTQGLSSPEPKQLSHSS